MECETAERQTDATLYMRAREWRILLLLSAADADTYIFDASAHFSSPALRDDRSLCAVIKHTHDHSGMRHRLQSSSPFTDDS